MSETKSIIVPPTAATASTSSTSSASVTYNFTGKLVLVTGSTLGIGKAIGEAFVRSGARVIINGRRADTVISVVNELTALLPAGTEKRIYGITADVGTADGSAKLIKETDALGNLDILVNNVAIFYAKAIFDVTDDEWMNIFQVNVMSCIRLSRHYLQKMLAANTGRIIMIGSEAGARPIGAMIHYSVSKTAVMGLTRGLAELTKGTRVTVNNMLAGPTYTEGVLDFLVGLWKKDNATKVTAGEQPPAVDQLVAAYFTEHEPTSLIKRFILPQELAHTVLFVASDSGASISGSNLRCEGGIIRSI